MGFDERGVRRGERVERGQTATVQIEHIVVAAIGFDRADHGNRIVGEERIEVEALKSITVADAREGRQKAAATATALANFFMEQFPKLNGNVL
ncbi:hypothetical protein LP420_37350 [Massilia sp. B-10]|nr:hypothetical protein LP420_37350 [Massilia sp. B-10]